MVRQRVIRLGALAGLILGVLGALQPRVDAQNSTQLFHIDYRNEYDFVRSQGDLISDGAYDFKHTWRFGVLTDPNGGLNSPRITVTPNGLVLPLSPNSGTATLVESSPQFVWVGPNLGPNSGFFTGLVSNLPVVHQLGYDASRSLAGGPGADQRVVAGGATETRAFTVTVTPRDETANRLNEVGISITFNGIPFNAPGPVSASVTSCVASAGSVNVGPDQRAHWQSPNPNLLPLPLTPVSVSCNIVLTNASSLPATYTPDVVISGNQATRTTPQPETHAVEFTTNASAEPADPLGTVRFEVTPTNPPATLQFTRHYTRTVHFDGVNLASTQPTSLNLQAVNLTYGQMQSLTLSVVPATPGPAATGTFTIVVDGGPSILVPVNIGGPTSFNLGSLPVGPHHVAVSYSGDSSYAGSFGSLALTVAKANPQFNVMAPPPYPYGQVNAVVINFQQGPNQQAPTGAVTYQIDGGGAQTVPVTQAPAKATLPLGVLAAGNHTVTWTYSGDSNFNLVSGPPIPISVTAIAPSPTTTFISGSSSSAFGTPVTFTAQVTSLGGVPTGNVTFMDGPNPIGTGLVSPSGQAAVTVSTLALGPHSISATYGGSQNFNQSTSFTIPHQVNQPMPPMPPMPPMASVVLTVTPASSTFGQSVTFSATVSSAGGTPTGSVTFRDGLIQVAHAPITGGVATATSSSLAAGPHTITAVYNGDPMFQPATSAPVSAVVTITIPPFSQPLPNPDNRCICTPLLMNTNTAGTQHWFVKASGVGDLQITAVAQAVNSVDPENVVASVYNSANALIATLTVGYPAGTPAGTEVATTTSIPAAAGDIFRVSVSTPSTPSTQPHYRLKFLGAEAAGTNSPSSPSFEHAEGDIWYFNLDAGEAFDVRAFVAGTPATETILRYGLTAPDGASYSGWVTSSTTVGDAHVTAPAAALAGTWALKLHDASAGPNPANGHYRLAKDSGADRGIYLGWESAGEAAASVSIVTGTSGGAPFSLPVTLTITGKGGSHTLTVNAGTFDFGKLHVGTYQIEISGVPTGWAVDGPALRDITVTCDESVVVEFVIVKVPLAPVASDDAFAGNEDTVLGGSVLGNDSDGNGDALLAAVVSAPSHGLLDLNADGTFTYWPAPNYHGPDSFTYTVSDGQLTSNVATVSLTLASVNDAPQCSATPSISLISPANRRFVSVALINGSSDVDGDAVTLAVTRIFQDEPTNTDSDASLNVDGGGIGTAVALVRAERAGTEQVPNNGRVYHIFYSGSDGQGGTCGGEVTVGVPRGRGNGSVLIDGGALFNSLTGEAP